MPDHNSLPCRYKVGFLFKRICGRVSRVGCNFCQGMARDPNLDEDYDPYFNDRRIYNRNSSYYRSYDFTDYDAYNFESESDTNYENDLDAS